MNPIMQMAMQQILSGQNVQNQAMARQFMQIVQTGNAKAGEELALNICQTYGINPQDAASQAMQGFQHMFGMN